MRLELRKLAITTVHKGVIEIDFKRITVFHGETGVGKTSILALADYALGSRGFNSGAMQAAGWTSIRLEIAMEKYDVVLERDAFSSSEVNIFWDDRSGSVGSVLAPIESRGEPIWADDVETFSDMMYHLIGIAPRKVRVSPHDPDSKLRRLSFRDMLWYCYIRQTNMTKLFYNLNDVEKFQKSRQIMRYLVGLHTDALSALEVDRDRKRQDRLAKQESVRQLEKLLEDFGFTGLEALIEEEARLTQKLTETNHAQDTLLAQRRAETHAVDDLRHKQQALAETLGMEEEALHDAERRLEREVALRAEIETTKMKMGRLETASSIIGEVDFDLCPRCGQGVEQAPTPGHCHLCKNAVQVNTAAPAAELIRRDLNSRLDDLRYAINRRERAVERGRERLAELQDEKKRGDVRLNAELAAYDSAYMSRARENERTAAEVAQRLRQIELNKRIPVKVDALKKEMKELETAERQIREEMSQQEVNLLAAAEAIRDIEKTYREFLLRIEYPGLTEDHYIVLDRTSWTPVIKSTADTTESSFEIEISNGKRVLLNITYALAIHTVAVRRKLPLPELIILDQPSQHIGSDVNKKVTGRFYALLYELAAGELKGTQFVIADERLIEPPQELLPEFAERRMMRDSPLVPAYEGL